METPTLHELNRGFEWTGLTGPFRCITPEQAAAYDRDGFFVLENAFDAATLAEVTAEIDPWEEKTEAFLKTRPDGRFHIARSGEITFTTHLVTRSPVLRRFVAHPVLRDLCRDLIGPDVRLYWDQAVYKKPGTAVDFPWHQDNGYTFIEPQRYLTCWIPLVHATEANGCPWVVPDLHRRGTLAHELTELGFQCLCDPPGAVAVPARAGSIVVFSSLTPHRTGPNDTDSVRKAYIVQYAPDGAIITLPDSKQVTCDAPGRQFPILSGGEPVNDAG